MSEGFVTSNDTFYSDDPEYRDIARTFDSIAGLVDGRDDFILALEAFHLPHISGRTAALMRREHYTLLLDMMAFDLFERMNM
ncbi:Actin family protein [Aspergillus niger]|uniref:Actin family protein n=1 Tax=Aspergillus niger TaxID=5061 RepID=A0A505IF67_ASPNG|nr:Actin family protein [Aspergillus niger]